MAGLEVQNLVKRYGQNPPAVDGASLDTAEGEVVALLGPSGCGKTTTLRAIAGFETPDSGAILLEGQSLLALAPHARGIGLVFQDYALFPHMTVADNIGYGLRRRGLPRATIGARVAEMLGVVRLDGLGIRRPAALSGGQQQRVALARALAISPRLLLLDEPLSNLDAKLRETLQVELRALLRRIGTTTLIVTHDQEEAMALADRIAIMHRGRILQQGTPERVYGAPASRFVASFLGRALWLEGRYDSGAFVTAAGRTLRCVPPDRVAAAHGLCIRPESLSLAPVEGANALAATLVATSFRGSHVAAQIRVEEATAVLDLPPGTALPPMGGELTLHVPPALCRVVPEDDA